MSKTPTTWLFPDWLQSLSLLGLLLLSLFLSIAWGKVLLLIAIFGIMGAVALPSGEVKFKFPLSLKPPKLSHLLLFLPIFLLTSVIQLGYIAILAKLGIEYIPQDIFKILLTLPKLQLCTVVFSVVVLAPIVEEIIFRKQIFSMLENRIGSWGALLFTSLLFASMHFQLHQVVGLFFLGCCWQYIYLKTSNLVTCIFLHALNNLLSVLLFWYSSTNQI